MRKYVISLPSTQLLVILALSSINTLGAHADFHSLCDPPVVAFEILLNYETFAAKSL